MSISQSLETLLSSTPPGQRGGFVVFKSLDQREFVQYALEADGLLLNWPTFQEGRMERLPQFVEILSSRGFVGKSPENPADLDRECIASLEPGEVYIADDGLYAKCGRDIDQVSELTAVLLREICKIPDLSKIKITLEVDG